MTIKDIVIKDCINFNLNRSKRLCSGYRLYKDKDCVVVRRYFRYHVGNIVAKFFTDGRLLIDKYGLILYGRARWMFWEAIDSNYDIVTDYSAPIQLYYRKRGAISLDCSVPAIVSHGGNIRSFEDMLVS